MSKGNVTIAFLLRNVTILLTGERFERHPVMLETSQKTHERVPVSLRDVIPDAARTGASVGACIPTVSVLPLARRTFKVDDAVSNEVLEPK